MRRRRLSSGSRLYVERVLEPAVADDGVLKTYLDAPHMGIRWDGKQLVMDLRARASSSDFRSGMETCLLALEETQATRLLLDCRNMRLVLTEDERWLAQELLPRFATTHLRWMAVVTPENPLAREIVKDLAKPSPTRTVSKHCATVEEAILWLSRTGAE
jgi:hypothetical protein